MHNLINWYNQNRKRIWITIILIVGIFFIARRLVFMLGNRDNISNKEVLQENFNKDLNSIVLSSQNSAITGKATPISKEGVTLIDKFVSYCNIGDLQQAYSLLTNECKQEMFPNINSFRNIYYNTIFGKCKRTVKIENWYGDIYLVDYNEDALSSGVYSSDNNIRDYITIFKDSDNNYKLNINKYIGRKIINKVEQKGNLQITVIRKDEYMDFEKYTFEIKNGSNNKVLLANVDDYENVSYLLDKNNIKYDAIATELSEAQLTVLAKQTKNIQIKYYNSFSSTKIIKGLAFPKICLDYDFYKTFQNKSIYRDYENIYFDL